MHLVIDTDRELPGWNPLNVRSIIKTCELICLLTFRTLISNLSLIAKCYFQPKSNQIEYSLFLLPLLSASRKHIAMSCHESCH